ncbi:hypothetical protein Q5P01_005548 [Channa striata]|uniref:Uncharacterized protein n=1 Tax=Channa striata TaxID=64152 RepID=A0AA88NCU8_CHASR|nr:hypothetical protein Q5P01_005548 [Channa striata]
MAHSTTSQCAVVTSQRGANQQTFSASRRDDVMPWMELDVPGLICSLFPSIVNRCCIWSVDHSTDFPHSAPVSLLHVV